MNKEVNTVEVRERVAVVENNQQQMKERLDKHEILIGQLKEQNIKQDAKLDQITKDTREVVSIGKDLKGGIHTIKYLVGGVTALIGLWVAVKQLGLF